MSLSRIHRLVKRKITVVIVPLLMRALLRLRSLLGRLNPSHHLLFRNQMVNALQQAEQVLHIRAPLVQHIVRIARFGKVHDPRRTVDLGVDRLHGDQVADVLFRLLLSQVEQLRQTTHLDARVVFGHNADVVLDHALAKILPALVGLVVAACAGRGVENVGAAEVRAELFRYHGPAHEFIDREEAEQAGFDWDPGVAGFGVDAVEEVGLLVVVGGEDNIIDDPLENLSQLVNQPCRRREKRTAWSFSGSSSTDSVSRTCR